MWLEQDTGNSMKIIDTRVAEKQEDHEDARRVSQGLHTKT